MSYITPIFASLNQDENDREEESFQRKKKVSIMITLMSSMIFLGLFYYSGGFGYSSFPTIFIFIIIIGLIRVISITSRSRSRGRSQNHSQRQRMEPSPLEHKPTTIKRNRKYCLQCGSKVDRDIDSLSMYYCSYCGYEIKNNRG